MPNENENTPMLGSLTFLSDEQKKEVDEMVQNSYTESIEHNTKRLCDVNTALAYLEQKLDEYKLDFDDTYKSPPIVLLFKELNMEFNIDTTEAYGILSQLKHWLKTCIKINETFAEKHKCN